MVAVALVVEVPVETGKIPVKWIRKYLSPDELAKITDVIGEVENITSAEIVPMVVKQSTPTGHVFPIMTLLFLLGCFYFQINHHYAWDFGLWIYPMMLTASMLVGYLLSRLTFFQRILTNDADEIFEVNERAELEFYRHIHNKTTGSTGVLLFVSLMERRAVVLADKSIAAVVTKETWDEVLEMILSGIRRGSLAEGLITGIEACEKHLETHFPPGKNKLDEIANQLIIKD